MRRSILLTHALTALLASLLPVGDSQAADPPTATAVVKLMLDKGWDKTKAARDVVKQQNLDVPPLKDDSRVRAAHWLVLMYQGNHNLALDSVRVFLAKHPTTLDALRAEVWMCMVEEDYGKALAVAQKLTDVIVPAQQGGEKAAAVAAPSDELVQFLGHVAGFLEGPANKANDAERQKFEAQLLARLSEAQKKQFQLGKQDVVEQYRGIQKQAAAVALKQQAKQGVEAAKQQKLGNLNEQSEKLSKDKAKVEADTKKVADDLKKKMADLEGQDALLQQQWMVQKNQSALLSNQIQQKEDQLTRLQQDAADPKNPQQQKAHNDARQMQDQLRELKARLNFATNEIIRLEVSHQRLVQQGLVGQWQFQNEGQKQQGQQQQLEQGMRKNAADQRRTEDAKATAAAEARALENKAIALETEAHEFKTYDRFPFAELRTKLLQGLR